MRVSAARDEVGDSGKCQVMEKLFDLQEVCTSFYR